MLFPIELRNSIGIVFLFSIVKNDIHLFTLNVSPNAFVWHALRQILQFGGHFKALFVGYRLQNSDSSIQTSSSSSARKIFDPLSLNLTNPFLPFVHICP